MLILSSGPTRRNNPIMQQLINNQNVAAVTVYSPMFNDSQIPRHIRPCRHTSALLIQESLEDALRAGAAKR